MSTDDFVYDDEAVQKEVAKKKEGKGPKLVTIDSGECYLHILGPMKSFKHKVPFHEWSVHKVMLGKKFHIATSGAHEDEEDPINDLGYKLYQFYQNSKDEKAKNVWQNFKPNDEAFANVIKFKKVTKKVKGKKVKRFKMVDSGPCRLPRSAYHALIDEINEEGTKSICDLDKGRMLIIKDNGKKGLARKYQTVKFRSKPTGLLKNKIISKEELEEIKESMKDLTTIPEPYSEAAIKKLLSALRKHFKKYVKKMEKHEDEEIDEADVMEEEDDDISDDTDLDDVDTDDDDDEVSIDEDDDEDVSMEDDDDDSDDDSDDDDDDDISLDDDDEDDDED